MTYTGNKVFNIFINSVNRSINDKSYDFTVYYESDEFFLTLLPTQQSLGFKFRFGPNCGLPSRPTSDGSESIGRAESVAAPSSVPLAKPRVPTSASSGRCSIS